MFRLVGYSIIIGPILVLLSGIFIWNEGKRCRKNGVMKVLLFWGALAVSIVLYTKCQWVNEFVDMHIFPDRSYVIEQEDQKQRIKLPPNSRWKYRTPDDVYATKCSKEEVVKFFNEELGDMKSEGELEEYIYDELECVFSVTIWNQKEIYIRIYDDHRFAISIKER